MWNVSFTYQSPWWMSTVDVRYISKAVLAVSSDRIVVRQEGVHPKTVEKKKKRKINKQKNHEYINGTLYIVVHSHIIKSQFLRSTGVHL